METSQSRAETLLEEYTAAETEANRIKTLYDQALLVRSNKAQALHAALGTGPFTYKERKLGRIICRDGTYFFRAPDKGGIVIP